MRYRVTFSAGLAVGYVLGARAGRERYETIVRSWRALGERPELQEAAGFLRARLSAAASLARPAPDDDPARLPPPRRGNAVDG